MKTYITLLLAIIINSGLSAQIFEPVTWDTSVEKIDADTYRLISTATIDQGWHLYSQNVPEKGPIATSFEYAIENDAIVLTGVTKEEKGKTVNDPVFKMAITFFENSATFQQLVKIKDKDLKTVSAYVEFMACDNTRCLPPTEVDLVFNIQ